MLPNKLQPTTYSKDQAQLPFQTIICLDPFNSHLKRPSFLTVNMTYTNTPHGQCPKIFFLKAYKAMQCWTKYTEKMGKNVEYSSALLYGLF